MARAVRRRGLSLTEAVMAVALLGSCLLGVLTVVVGGLGLSDKSEQMTIATELAREEMEAVKERGFLWPPPGHRRFDGSRPDPTVNGFPPGPYPSVERDGHEYTFYVTVSDVATNVRSIQVQVKWRDRSEVFLETYLHP